MSVSSTPKEAIASLIYGNITVKVIPSDILAIKSGNMRKKGRGVEGTEMDTFGTSALLDAGRERGDGRRWTILVRRVVKNSDMTKIARRLNEEVLTKVDGIPMLGGEREWRRSDHVILLLNQNQSLIKACIYNSKVCYTALADLSPSNWMVSQSQ